MPVAFAILPTCAPAGPEVLGFIAVRPVLSASDPGVDVSAAICGLGRPVPGMSCDNKPMLMLTNTDAREILSIGPPLFDPDLSTDRTDRFCASELIRETETLFERLGKELP